MSSIRARLSVVVGEGEEEQRFITPNNEFNSGDVVISSSGLVQVRGSSTLKDHFNPKELQILEVIGSGACSTVRKAVYQGTTVVALKQINIFNSIGHRNQLVEEIKSLYKTDCAAIVKFYGAYLQDNNHIAIVLEYLDGGSLGNVLDQVGPVPEGAIANIAFQVLWGRNVPFCVDN
ncbi:hypothetical protein BASA81_007090 [Batrachochytrium salamandrivorans]|nr:hypothetical protein BASA81_007090 [Batrachochytrium salamandrivorans]